MSSQPLSQHQVEIEQNSQSWQRKPLLREIYAGFYREIIGHIDESTAGRILEIGSGMGLLKQFAPKAILSDLFPNPWLDLVVDGYEIPFRAGSLSHLVLFDVFHHLEFPAAFLREAGRVLGRPGRLIIFDPYVSWISAVAYGWFHHEPVAWSAAIDRRHTLPRPRSYYAAEGNTTRIFFRKEWPSLPGGWKQTQTRAWSSFSYLFSGGFSKPAFYSISALPLLRAVDRVLSRCPRVFAARCLVVLERE